MDLRLERARAVILGGTRGIGRAIAETFADEGADVALCARKADQVSDAVTALNEKGVRAFGAAVDIADSVSLRAWIDKVAGQLGGIDILVSNASAMAPGPNVEDWEANFRTDLLGAVNAFQAAKFFLEKSGAERGDAAFVIISSISATENIITSFTPAEADVASSFGPIKAALIHYAKGLAHQYAARRIRANVVSPGLIYFKGSGWNLIEADNPELFRQVLARNPTGRAGVPQEVANAVVFLASPKSSFITGVNLVVDGAISRRVNF